MAILALFTILRILNGFKMAILTIVGHFRHILLIFFFFSEKYRSYVFFLPFRQFLAHILLERFSVVLIYLRLNKLGQICYL